ncbi:hypothetical protein [Poseidonocella sp. HB161398]|uniref:hypothetical protein n=1 Tax=Poseidonocella sp. HB161398 TaxID=2320855 RepID=UPI0011081210|nr:hypothetical protein [Poseidonocella sp. HB161398]
MGEFDQPRPTILWSPGAPHPKYADRKTLAIIISHECFPVAPRTLRDWPLVAIRPGKRVIYDVQAALSYARALISAAPTYKQGK